eukprot:1141146-Pelagomonas_calceolata.AAC.5
MGQKVSSGHPCIPALLGTHNWLANAQTALPTPPSNNTPNTVSILEVWVVLLYLYLCTPCCHCLEHVALTLSQAHCPHPLPNFYQKGANQQSLSQRVQ